MAEPKFRPGDVVRKKSGSEWQGAVVWQCGMSLELPLPMRKEKSRRQRKTG